MSARKGGHEIFAESGKTGLTNAAMRGIIYLAFAGVAHLVERDLAKVEVASSSLVARSKKKNHPLGGFSFWNAAGRMELAASTGAKRVKSGGEGRVPANGSAIRGMPGSEFELRLFCCAEREKYRKTALWAVFLRLSKKPVIASQCAHWRGNPFPNRIIPALFRRFPAKRLRIPTPVTSVTGSE